MNNRHYCDYDAGKLISQEAFCQHLIDLGRLGEIEDEHVNPMTIRLLITKESLGAIDIFCREVADKLTLARQSIDQLRIPGAIAALSKVGTSVSGAVSVTPGFTVSHPLPRGDFPNSYYIAQYNTQYYHVVKDGTHWYHAPNISVNSFALHKALYQFFTNFISSLDRMALEVSRLIPGTNARHFSQLTDNASAAVRFLNGRGNNNLTNISIRTSGPPANHSEKVMEANKYRNRVVHDGIIRIDIDQSSGTVYLPDDPEAVRPNFNLPTAAFCRERFESLINLLNSMYSELLSLIH